MDQALVVQQLATFFALGTLSEKATLEMTLESYSIYNRNFSLFKIDPDVSFIRASQPLLIKYFKKNKKNKIQEDIRRLIVVNTQVDINKWRTFVKKASAEEISIIIFYYIFKLNEKIIADSLKVSEGTVRLRVVKSLRLLGDSL